MKKLLAIIVLSLLWSGNANAFVSKKLQQQYIDKGLIKVGMKMSDFYPIVKSTDTLAFVPNYKNGGKYLFLLTSRSATTQVYLAEATNSNPKKNKSAWGTIIGWKLEKYKLIKIYDDPIDAFDHYITLEKDPKGLKRINVVKAYYIKNNQEPTKTIQSNTASSGSSSMSTEDKITQAKLVCTDLGFKPKSEKFADCALKLVTLDFERTITTKNEPQVVIHKNVSDTNIFDELGVLFRQQGIIQDTSRPANTRNNIRCTSTTTAFGQVVTNCR